MAQIYVGTNNINLLVPNGRFGSRVMGGSDASSPRYIFTLLSQLTKLIFKEEDNNILNYLEEDGQQIEPEYYMPIIPMILVNGGIGIGTGFSPNIPQFNPHDIITLCSSICDLLSSNELEDDVEKMQELIDDIAMPDFTPWYLGFTGTIKKSAKTYISSGVYNWINDNTLEIIELPIGTWTEDYKEMLEEMITNNSNFLKSIESHYTSKNVRFILHFNGDVRGKLGDKFESEFKLASTKNLSINNMHLYSSIGSIKKYENTSHIIKEWTKVRIKYYYIRKQAQVVKLEKDLNVLSAKIRFILDVIEGNILIMNKKIADITERLIELQYPKISEGDGEQNYNYLLKLPISQLTYDRKIILEKEVTDLATDLNNLKKTPIESIWKNELMELLEAWIEHKTIIETDYDNDKKGIVQSTKPKKTAAKTKKTK